MSFGIRETFFQGNSVPTTVEANSQCSSTFSIIQSTPGRNTFRQNTNFMSPQTSSTIRSIDDSNVDRKDTSSSSVFKKQHTLSTIGHSVAVKRKSIFELSTNNSETAQGN